MEFIVQPHEQDPGVRPVESVAFDMLRTLVAARQASSPTVRALQTVRVTNDAETTVQPTSMALFTGRRQSANYAGAGAFADRFAVAHPFAIEGESHG